MNPTTEPPPPPQPPVQPPRSSFHCDRHPDEHFTGFCPLCLCERLTTLDQQSSTTAAGSSSSRRPSTSSSTAAAALKAIFRVPSSISTNGNSIVAAESSGKGGRSGSSRAPSFFPELRRTKSFSASKNEGFSGVFEPQRRSCDVRGRNTLWTLFSIDDENKCGSSRNLGGTGTVPEAKEEEEEHEIRNDEDDDDDEIRVSEEQIVDGVNQIVEEEEKSEEKVEEDVKRMKDHIDLDSQVKKPSLGGFWSAASVFSKKWHKWRRKQKLKKGDAAGNVDISTALPAKKPISRQYRETQSEIADYGFGRRSCDTDPRFSLDAGRISFDDPRYSFDEPRASWDGYLIGRTFPRLPPMVEDAPVIHVARSDMQIPVEEPPNFAATNADDNVPGGSTQTREYYSDSSSKRRKSLDRSSSIRKTAAAVVAEMDEMKTAVSNAKVSPATIDYIHGPKLGNGERELIRDSNSNSLRDDCSETFELGFRDNGTVIGAEERKGSKKLRRWTWNLWGFIHRRGGGNNGGGNKDEDDERYSSRVNGVERSFSESWQDMRREGNGEVRNGFNRKVFRSNSSVSWRNSSYNMANSGSFARKSFSEMNANGNGNGNGKNRGREEFVLERNRSARYSPNHNHIDNGLLRFYLTPLRGSRRGGIGVGSGKSRPSNSHSIARNVLRLY